MRATAVLFVLTCAMAPAQREEAPVDWQKHRATIEWNALIVGRHKLDELKVGETWRMGRNEASHLKTDMALLVNEQIVVPGSYRVVVTHPAESEYAFTIDGGSLGAAPRSSPAPVSAKGTMTKAGKPSKALEVAIKPQARSSTPIQRADVVVTFGEHTLSASLSLVGCGKPMKGGGFTFEAFALPAEIVDAHTTEDKPLPVGVLKKETGDRKNPHRMFNLVVTKDGAELWPAPVAPAQAFNEVKGLEASAAVKATETKWEDAASPKPFLEATRLDYVKAKGFTIALAGGKKTCTLTIPEPKLQ